MIEVEDQREEDDVGGHSDAAETMDEDNGENSNSVPLVTSHTEEVRDPPTEELTESEAFILAGSSQAPAAGSLLSPVASLRPPPREDRLPSFGRNTLPYEDVIDDGIVPSTPVLLRPRTNDGFAEAVSSPQVNTRFVFGSIPDLSLPSGSGTSAQHGIISHLESQGMEDTRMDLSQLEDSAGRSVPSTPVHVSPLSEMPSNTVGDYFPNPEAAPASAAPPTAAAVEDQGDFEGGPDLEGDAAAELDLLGEEDPEPREGDNNCPTIEQEAAADKQAEESQLVPSPAPVEPSAESSRAATNTRLSLR